MRKIETLDYMLDYIEVLIHRIPDDNQYKQDLLIKYKKYREMFERNPEDLNLRHFVIKYVTDLEAYVKGFSTRPPTYYYENLPVLSTGQEDEFSDITNLNDYVNILSDRISNANENQDINSLRILTNHVQEEYAQIKVKNQLLEQKICNALFILMLKYIKENEIAEAKKVAEKFGLDMRIYLINYLKPQIESLKKAKRFNEAEFIWKYIYGNQTINENNIEFWFFIARLEKIIVGYNTLEADKPLVLNEKVTFLDRIRYLFFNIKSATKKLIIRNDNGKCNTNDIRRAIDQIFSYNGNDRYELVFQEGITNISFIDNFADYSMQNIDKDCYIDIVFPASAKEISAGAFEDLTCLKKINMSNSIISKIGIKAFYRSSIEDIKFSHELMYIGDRAFMQCRNIDVIDLSNTCLINIGDAAFRDTRIKKVLFSTTLCHIGEYAFAETTKLKNVNFENTILRTIGIKAFFKSRISSIKFSKDLTTIGNLAFEQTKFLYSISLENTKVTKLSYGIFKGSNILYVFLPQELDTIDSRAFEDCKCLTYLNLKNTNVKAIFDYAFFNSAINTIILPKDLSQLNANVFVCMPYLSCVDFSYTSLKSINTDFTNSHIKTIVLNSAVRYINAWNFKNCKNLEYIDMSRCLPRTYEKIKTYIEGIAAHNRKFISFIYYRNDTNRSTSYYKYIYVIKPHPLKNLVHKVKDYRAQSKKEKK